ncbi:hypothetical protein BDV97DRAFT_7428 [Delphinella strobiligena]|nr:hypothetical protein BDV97DRAFT_7428 [Delphinella strobiligena]
MSYSLCLYFAASVACLTAALFLLCRVSGDVLVLPSFLAYFELLGFSPAASAAAQARIVLVWLVGAFLGVPCGIPAASGLGRSCLRSSAARYIVDVVMQSAEFAFGESELWLLIFEVGRFVSGVEVGVGTFVSPI